MNINIDVQLSIDKDLIIAENNNNQNNISVEKIVKEGFT